MKPVSPTEALLACLFVGLVAGGGLRDSALWTAAGALVWLVGLAWAPAKVPGFMGYWACWLAWALLSVATSDQPWKGLYAFARWATVIAFFCLAAAHWTERDSKRWLAGLSASALALGLGSLWVPGTVHPMTGLLPPYYNYTMFAQAAFLAAAMAALLHARGPAGWRRLALAGLAGFSLFILLKARSRGALGGVAVAAAFWMLRHHRARALLWVTAAAAAAALCLPYASAYLLKLDMSAWFTRPQIWRAALQVAGEHPWLGEGPGNFEQGFLRHDFPKHWAVNYGFYADHAHSEPLELAAETGWIGLALFLAALWQSVRVVGEREASETQEAGLCSLVAMSAQCAVDNMLQLPALGMLYFSAIACAGAPARDAPAAARPRGRSSWPRVAVALLGLLLCLAAYWPRRLVERYTELARREADPRRRLVFLEQAIRLQPADYYLRELAARACLDARPPDRVRASSELLRASELYPTNALYPRMLAGLAWEEGEAEGALALLNRAIALEPNFLDARVSRARIWSARGRGAEARRELNEVLKRRESLRSATTYSDYERAIVAFDPKAFEEAEAAIGRSRRPRRG